MKTKSWMLVSVLIASFILASCQSTSGITVTDKKVYPLPKIMIEPHKDTDRDGVIDFLDNCPTTPEGVVTDEYGCPFTTIGIGLKMEYRAFFNKGSSELLPKYRAKLDKVGMKLQEYKTATILIEGHNSRTEVDSASIDEANALAQDRANKIKNYLISKYNIASERITATEYGARRPIAPSDSEEDNMLNRRVYAIASEPQE